MDKPSGTKMSPDDVIDPSIALYKAESNIHTVFEFNQQGGDYDDKAWFYDRVIGHSLYNRWVWKNRPENYAAFASDAADSGKDWMLDAGCGTLVFTHEAYRRAQRPAILLDRSLGMLRRAERRLAGSNGAAANILLLQADLRDLPFRDDAFGTILSMGMLHLFDQPETLLAPLTRTLKPGGRFYASALIAETDFGRRYLHMLHRAGEVGAPRRADDLRAICQRQSGLALDRFETIGNMAYMVFSKLHQ